MLNKIVDAVTGSAAWRWALALFGAIGGGILVGHVVHRKGVKSGAENERSRTVHANLEAVGEADRTHLEGEEKAKRAFERHQQRTRDDMKTHAGIEAAKELELQDPHITPEDEARWEETNAKHREALERLKVEE